MIWKLFLFSRLMSTLKTTQNWKRKTVFKGEKQGKLELLTTSSSCSFFISLFYSCLYKLITAVLPQWSGMCASAQSAHHRHLTPKNPCGDPQEGRISASRLLQARRNDWKAKGLILTLIVWHGWSFQVKIQLKMGDAWLTLPSREDESCTLMGHLSSTSLFPDRTRRWSTSQSRAKVQPTFPMPVVAPRGPWLGKRVGSGQCLNL